MALILVCLILAGLIGLGLAVVYVALLAVGAIVMSLLAKLT